MELVGEQREVLYDALAEVIEDLALAHAIEEASLLRQQAGQRFQRSWRARFESRLREELSKTPGEDQNSGRHNS